jgi:hypothetical protein
MSRGTFANWLPMLGGRGMEPRSKFAVAALVIVVAVLLAAFLLIHECASGGGMGARYQACDCRGIEWVLYDQTPADGPRKTICLGRIRSTTCYRFIGGPQVECPR